MKNTITLSLLLLLAILLTTNCSTVKKAAKTEAIKKIKPEAKLVMVIQQPAENFIWERGDLLTLEIKFFNNSDSAISIMNPLPDYNFQPDLYHISVENSFDGLSCIYEISEDADIPYYYASKYNVVTIEPKNAATISFSHHAMEYCSENDSEENEVCLKIKLLGATYTASMESEFIRYQYKQYSLEEKKHLISLYNNLAKESIESNTICIKTE